MSASGFDLYHETAGGGVPILLIHPSGATASTWGAVTEELARIGRVITYDRRGYARSGGERVRSVAQHTADAAALLEHLEVEPAIVVGTSAGATIAVDLAVRRPDLVRAAVVHEAAWRAILRVPTAPQAAALARIGSLELLGRHVDAAETLLRFAYSYRDGGSAWDDFPEAWRQAGRDNARAALTDFRISIGNYPARSDLATVAVPVVCSYGERSPERMSDLTHALAAAMPTGTARRVHGGGHAAPFDATANFVEVIAGALAKSGNGHHR